MEMGKVGGVFSFCFGSLVANAGSVGIAVSSDDPPGTGAI